MSGGSGGNRRLASAFVTPSHHVPSQTDNVTLRGTNVALALTFSPPAPQRVAETEKVIDALEDMELLDENDGGMMEYDVQDDDLLADDLMDMEEQARSTSLADASIAKVSHSGKKVSRSGVRRNATLGFQSKMKEFLRGGSPRVSSAIHSSNKQVKSEKSRRHVSKKSREGSSTNDGLMGSKYPSNRSP